MARGKAAKDGDTHVAANGYHYTRTDGKWRLTHHIIAEKELGRSIDSEKETVRFADSDRANLTPGNIIVVPLKGRSKAAQVATLHARIADLQDKLDVLQAKLKLLEQA